MSDDSRISQADDYRAGKPHPRSYYDQARTQEVPIFAEAADVLPYDDPAFERTWNTRPVTFECAHCGQVVTQERYPGPTPTYCGEECQRAATEARRRELTRERVRRLRERRKQSS